VPRAAQDFSLARDPVLARLRGLDQAVSWPSHRFAALCGQRLDSAKNSPDRLNSTMARPFTSTSLRPPGAISETAATTCLAMSRFHDFSPKLAREMSGTGMPPSIALQRASSACDFFSATSSTSRI